MPPPTRPLKRAQIEHILRAAAAITGENTFTLVGANDLALSKLCAWRGKDQTWLHAALRAGFLDLAAMAAHAARITAPAAPSLPELLHRLARLPAPAGADEQRTRSPPAATA